MQDNAKESSKWKRYEFLFEGTKDIIFYFSRTGEIVEANHSLYEELGYTREDKIYVQDIFRNNIKAVDGIVDIGEDILNTVDMYTIYRKNQTCLPVQVRISLIESGGEDYAVCRASNVWQEQDTKKQLLFAKEEIEEVHKERNEMVANVTHELRTPVNGVMGLAQNLLDTDLDGEQRETVELIDKCCKNMIKIINNILDFSKMQAGKFTIENHKFDFMNMMDDIIRVNRSVAEEKGLKLECNITEDIPKMLVGDDLRITQVLNNLLSNAIKFTAMGQVVVTVIKSQDLPDDGIELFFMVIDSGIGISEDEMDKLFKSFSQVDASITRKFGGTGLGLSIVRNLVQMMGGDINVESEKGKGSTFSFSLHLKKDSEEKEEKQDDKPIESYSFNIGTGIESDEELSDMYKLGSSENIREINANMEKLVLCIEMENWERANTFADNIKKLVAEDAMNLKRKAFRLQMTLRKGDRDTSIAEYDILKEAIEEMKAENK